MTRRRGIVRAFRDADDIVKIFSGKRIKDFVDRAVELVGDDIKKRVDRFGKGVLNLEDDAIPTTGPYSVLHCRPGAALAIVKVRFRELAHILHPDTGTHPDPAEFQRVREAYEAILAERKDGGAAPKAD